jgi:formate/nitrite transporter FocA (FNT family)
MDNKAMNFLVALAFIAILGSLAAALFFMMRGSSHDEPNAEQLRAKRMARALTFRIGFSVALFLIVLLSYLMGWIHPTGFNVGQ